MEYLNYVGLCADLLTIIAVLMEMRKGRPEKPSGQKKMCSFRTFRLCRNCTYAITKSPKQSSFGWTKEPTMSIKLSFQVRFGKWRLTLSISR